MGNPRRLAGFHLDPYGDASGYTDAPGLIYFLNSYYNPATGHPERHHHLLLAHPRAVVVTYAVGGNTLYGGDHLRAVEIYDPVAGRWLAGPTAPVSGRPDVRNAAEPASHRRRWLRAAIAVAMVVLAALVLAGVWAWRYQPVSYGDGAVAVQGQVAIRSVNDFGQSGQIFLPPQPSRPGALIVSLANQGHLAVTIESVNLGEQAWPLALARDGSATYVPLVGTNPEVTASSPPVKGPMLAPHENILIRIPFRRAACWNRGFAAVSTFLLWTHTFSVGRTDPTDPDSGAILTRAPAAHNSPAAVCH